jgi:hypothetical protein
MLHFYSKIWRKTISKRGSPSKVSPRARPPPRAYRAPALVPRFSSRPCAFRGPFAPSQCSSLLAHAACMPRPPGTPRRRGPCCCPPWPPPYRRGPCSARAALSRSHYRAPPIRVAAPSWTRRTPSPTTPHLPSPGTAAMGAAFTGRRRAARRCHHHPVQRPQPSL